MSSGLNRASALSGSASYQPLQVYRLLRRPAGRLLMPLQSHSGTSGRAPPPGASEPRRKPPSATTIEVVESKSATNFRARFILVPALVTARQQAVLAWLSQRGFPARRSGSGPPEGGSERRPKREQGGSWRNGAALLVP